MNFESFSDCFISQRWAALNEVFDTVAAAVGKGALDCRRRTPSLRAGSFHPHI